jgi:hypothetical protein
MARSIPKEQKIIKTFTNYKLQHFTHIEIKIIAPNMHLLENLNNLPDLILVIILGLIDFYPL